MRPSVCRQLQHSLRLCQPANTSSPSSKLARRRGGIDIVLLGAGGLAVSGWLLYSSHLKARGEEEKIMREAKRKGTFTIEQAGPSGEHTTRTLHLLSPTEVDARLKQSERSYGVNRPGNAVVRYDTCNVPSNPVIEDNSSFALLTRTSGLSAGSLLSKGAGEDLTFFSVFDGHGGWRTSSYLSRHLVASVAKELDGVLRGLPPAPPPTVEETATPSSSGAPTPQSGASTPPSDISTPATTPPSTPQSSSSSKLDALWSYFSRSPTSPSQDERDQLIHAAIQRAFLNLDSHIVSAPLELLKPPSNTMTGFLMSSLAIQPFTEEQIEQKVLPAINGSCALLAFLDSDSQRVHVACTGDSRAVMGNWVPAGGKDGKGKWEVHPLSEDQTGRNLKEVERMRAEHPADEKDEVIIRGRVLGGLEPTRAFGDARYKWTRESQERIAALMPKSSFRGIPRHLRTPPYVTSVPVLQSSSLLPTAPPGATQPTARRFIVLATDGLYDRLTSEEVVGLVGAYLSGHKGSLSRSVLNASVVSPKAGTDSNAASHVPQQTPTRGESNVFCVRDENVATHLIRNALGGARDEMVGALLSIPPPASRRYRDDITVTVVLLDNPEVAPERKGAPAGVYDRTGEVLAQSQGPPPSAKL